MADIQLLIDDDAERTAVQQLLAQEGYEATAGDDLQAADLYLVDDYSFPEYREALRAEKRERQPSFCPVFLIHREGTRIDLDVEHSRDPDEPLLVNETIEAPVDRAVFFRRLTNLLVRQRQTEALADRNERLDDFASKASHELRNPLNVLAGRLELARETGDEEHLAAMEQSIDRIHRLVEDVLSLARTGDVEVDPEPVDLAAVVEECWSSVETAAGTLDVGTTATVLADEDRLLQVLSNLLRNAVEHGGRDVTVTVGTTATGFYVADDGPGIPPADRGRVLERGHAGDGHGTGLGLSIVAEVASAHDWDLAVTESEAGGARFEFRAVELVDGR